MKNIMLKPNDKCTYMRRRINYGIAAFLILLLFLAGCDSSVNNEPIPLQIEALQNAIDQSASYLKNHTKEDVMFYYLINMNPTIKVEKGYNILRHAGAMYAMSMHYQVKPDVNMRQALERAGTYLRDEAMGPISGKKDMLAIWSKPDVSNHGGPLQAKLGGTGLGLVALLSLEKIHPGFTPLSDLQKLGRFIVYMQKENGRFISKYIPSKGGYQDNWQSLFYPGEAVLGLLMLYEKDPSEVWIESAAKALAYLANSRKNKSDVPADHWALLATEKILSFKNSDEHLPVSRELLINHAIQICKKLLRKQIIAPGKTYDGAFSNKGHTTPTATRLEGLLAALYFLPEDHEILKPIHSAVHRGTSFLVRSQVTEGNFTGAFPRSVGKKNRFLPGSGEFNRRATEVRIDFVQHALSAMIQYQYLMSNKSMKKDL